MCGLNQCLLPAQAGPIHFTTTSRLILGFWVPQKMVRRGLAQCRVSENRDKLRFLTQKWIGVFRISAIGIHFVGRFLVSAQNTPQLNLESYVIGGIQTLCSQMSYWLKSVFVLRVASVLGLRSVVRSPEFEKKKRLAKRFSFSCKRSLASITSHTFFHLIFSAPHFFFVRQWNF